MAEFVINFKLDNGDGISGIHESTHYSDTALWIHAKIEEDNHFIMQSIEEGCALIIIPATIVWLAVEPFDREEYERAKRGMEAEGDTGNGSGT